MKAAASNSSRWLLAVGAIALAVALLWAGAAAHLRMACMVMDTPYLPLCPADPADASELQQQLRERIRRDPGDSEAWTQLMLAGDMRQDPGVLHAAVLLAPGDPNVMNWRAAAAVDARQLPEAVRLLIENVRYRSSGASAQVLAQILATKEGVHLLQPYLDSANLWLPSVLGAMPAVKAPAPLALTLVMQAQEKGRLPDAAWRSYMRALKAGGHWVDAYGLWLASRKDPVPLLYNGSFDEAFEPDGFDWEFNPVPRSRAGVLMEQEALARRGMVLDLEFTGRSFPAIILRQHVFTAPGGYRLQGEYMASQFRSEEGLVWSVVCTGGSRAVVGRSAPMRDTGGVWKRVELEFSIPADCGPVASVQLEPASPLEATAGMHGEVALDGYSLSHALLP